MRYNINIDRRTGQMTILPTQVVCSTGSTNAPFIFMETYISTYPKNENNYHLVLSTGNINLKVINSLNDIQKLVLPTGYISGLKA